jgi:hypothetical protein
MLYINDVKCKEPAICGFIGTGAITGDRINSGARPSLLLAPIELLSPKRRREAGEAKEKSS